MKLIRQIPAMATAKPAKNVGRSRSSPRIRKWVSRAVKQGDTEMMTPTLEAMVYVRAMFSSR